MLRPRNSICICLRHWAWECSCGDRLAGHYLLITHTPETESILIVSIDELESIFNLVTIALVPLMRTCRYLYQNPNERCSSVDQRFHIFAL